MLRPVACPLTALANIISMEVDVVTKVYSQKGLAFPSLDDPQLQPSPLDVDPSLVERKALIAAAAAQILAMVRPPVETFLEMSSGMYKTATSAFVVDTNIPDILKEAGAAGLNIKDIAVKSNVQDASYIARVLRFLATRHIFKEVSPDVFANNRLSSLLTKAKSLKKIRTDPAASFDGAPLASYISLFGDEGLPSSVFLSSFMQDPARKAAPFNLGFKTEAKLWDWYEEHENEWRARRFSVAISGSADRQYAKADFIDGVLAASLMEDDVIVDVGGSMGSMTHLLYQEMPHYRYVVQDLEKPIDGGKQFWNDVAPFALASGRVDLQVHNFFNPQPTQGAGLYLLRSIIHDWPDQDAKIILQRLRDAASLSSKLIIFDLLAIHTCKASSVTSASGHNVPYPLLPCLGIAGAGFITGLDITMLNFFNGKERTERDFRELGKATGWKLQSVISGVSLAGFLYTTQ